MDKPQKYMFQRWGDLSPVIQRGYKSNLETFHAPPSRRGFYAYPKGQIETFLLSRNIFDHRLYERLPLTMKQINEDPKYKDSYYSCQWKSEKANCYWDDNYGILSDEELEQFQNENQYICKLKSPKIFRHSGMIWHHLNQWTPLHEIEQEKESWILTTSEAHYNALLKEFHSRNYRKKTKQVPYCRDYIEVFIEKNK